MFSSIDGPSFFPVCVGGGEKGTLLCETIETTDTISAEFDFLMAFSYQNRVVGGRGGGPPLAAFGSRLCGRLRKDTMSAS